MATQKKVWMTPLVREITVTPELEALVRKIADKQAPDRDQPLKRKMAS